MIIKYNENITNYNVVVDYLSKNGESTKTLTVIT